MADTRPQASDDIPRPPDIGKKFTADGTVLPFPGNTIVCHIDPASDFYQSLLVFREKIRGILGDKVSWLPDASWHVTVFEGVCDQVRVRNLWPADLALDAPLEQVHDLFTERLSSRPLDEQPPYDCKIVGIKRTSPTQLGNNVSLQVQPGREEDLRKLRDKLSEITGIRHAKHEFYMFHVTLAYSCVYLTDAEKQALVDAWDEHAKTMSTEFKLGAPEYCLFDNMYEFKRQFYLGA